jgi:hypothetical protein
LKPPNRKAYRKRLIRRTQFRILRLQVRHFFSMRLFECHMLYVKCCIHRGKLFIAFKGFQILLMEFVVSPGDFHQEILCS